MAESHAIQKLGMSSGDEIAEAVSAGRLPHVVVEAGANVKSATPPYSEHRFFYVTSTGTPAASSMSLKLLQWIQVCVALGSAAGDFSEMEPRHIGWLTMYTGRASIDPDSFGPLVEELTTAHAVILPDALRQLTGGAGAGGPSLDSLLNAGGGRTPTGDSHTVSGPLSSNKAAEEGEIYIRADGKKVRRVKKKPASGSQSVAPAPTLSSHLGTTAPAKGPGGDSATVPGNMGQSQPSAEEGEIYIRADGKKVRRVKKKKADGSSASVAPAASSLGSMLDSAPAKATAGDSATVPGNMGATSNAQEEGEIYIRADGKKVRRVKKKPAGDSATVAAAPAAAEDEEGEIYIRADGKKVRRVKKKPASTLDGLLSANPVAATPGSGSATVTGAESSGLQQEGEIYIRADGKKVRRIKKTRSVSGKGLSTFLGNNDAQRPGGGSATVSGDGKELGEIYIRADGKKVRRVKKMPQNAPADSQSLAGFLGNGPGGGTGMSGSATVTGAEGRKAQYAEGEIYIRPDGKRVRRIKKTAKSEEEKKKEQEEEEAKKAEEEAAKAAENGEEPKPEDQAAAADQNGEAQKPDLAGFLDQGAAQKPPMSGSATVAGDMVARGDNPDEEVEIITRPDGTKVRRIRRRVAATGAGGEEGEIITRPDGTKVRRIVRKSVTGSAAGDLMVGSTHDVPIGEDGAILAAPEPLTPEEEEIAEGYRKMLKMGMPAEAVGHKMTADGASEKISQAVLGGGAPAEATPAAAPQTTGGAIPALNSEEEEIATTYRRMLKMGMPAEAVGHKMTADGVSEKISKAVLGGGAAPMLPPAAAPAAQAVALTPEEEETAAGYRKMLKMGMPAEAVGHKMTADGVSEKISKAVLAPPDATPKEGDGAHAYIVVVGDENKAAAGAKLEAAPDTPDPTIGADGEQRFAVKVSKDAESQPQQLSVETDVRYLTLDELANLSGQSKEDLNEVVKQKMNLDKATPRFILSSKDEAAAAPVGTAAAAAPAPPAAAAPAAAPAPAPRSGPPPPGSKLLPDGMTAVPDDVAEAARAVSAMGATDLQSLMEKLNQGDIGEILKKLAEAEKRQKKLEKQLAQSGIAIADDIPYEEAKEKVEEIAKRMNEIGGSDVTHPDKEVQTKMREEYFKLEQEMERYNSALMLTEEYQAEQDRIEKKWEEDNMQANIEALKQMRRHMPVNIRNLSEAALTNNPSPNGKFLPKLTAKKFKRTNVLMLIRISPDDIERMHPSTLDTLRVTGLTLTERRALYAHLAPCGPKWNKNKAEKMTERKWTWYNMMKNNFKEALAPYMRHIAQYGPPENHPYATRDDPSAGCPLLGKQCPVKADKNPDYTGDYGWTDEPEFETSNVTKSDVDDPGAKAMQEALELAKEKKANERATALKKHYKGVMFVSKANGSCENMDESMDKMEAAQTKWIENEISKPDYTDDDKKKEIASFTDSLNDLKLAVLDFAARAGMQTSGKKKAGGDGPDTRATVECSLSEEVFECANVFFKYIKDRMDELKVKDTRVSKTIELLEGMLGDLHTKNVDTIKKLGEKKPERSRKLKTTEDLKKAAAIRMAPTEEEAPDADAFGLDEKELEARKAAAMIPRGGGGRGGLLDAIAGGRGRGRGGGGRGGLMDAIAGRGRGGGPPGRGGLMDAIAGRGRGGGGGDGGGRGGLMAVRYIMKLHIYLLLLQL